MKSKKVALKRFVLKFYRTKEGPVTSDCLFPHIFPEHRKIIMALDECHAENDLLRALLKKSNMLLKRAIAPSARKREGGRK